MSKAEQFIKDYTRGCSNEMVFEDGSGSHLYEPWLTPDQALRAVEIAMEELIDKACEWFKEHSLSSNIDYFIEKFKQAMEE